MSIAEPFCEIYKPSVSADGSCFWDTILFWDNAFKPVGKHASVVTEFNLVSRQCNWLVLKLTLLRSVIVSFFESSGTASLEEDPSLVPS